MAKQTAVDYLLEELKCNFTIAPKNNFCGLLQNIEDFKCLVNAAKNMEKHQLKDAVMYGLDEDGHTGDWKISVAEGYYTKTYTNGN